MILKKKTFSIFFYMVDFFSGLMYTINNFIGIDLQLRGEVGACFNSQIENIPPDGFIEKSIFARESWGELQQE